MTSHNFVQDNQKIEARSKRVENSGSQSDDSMQSKLVYKKLTGIELPKKGESVNKPHLQNLIKTQRFMKNNWYYHEDAIVHSIKNRSDKYTLEVETLEYLPYHFYPIFSEVKVAIDGINLLEKNPYNKHTLSYKRLNDKSVQFNIKVDLMPNQEVVITIPVIKMMKSFENYPHDPQRGHDIISVPVTYRIKEKNSDLGNEPVVKISKNVVAFLPEPDFSMPFNIITFVCVLMGYIFLQVFRISTEQVKSEGHDDNILKKILDLFRN